MSRSSKEHWCLLLRQLRLSKDCCPRKEFLKICWIGQDDMQGSNARECEHLQRQCRYLEWLLNVGGVTPLNEPRVSTPESCSDPEVDSFSTCPPPSVDTSVLVYDATIKANSSLRSSLRLDVVNMVLSLSPVQWKSGRTPSPVNAPRRCREPPKATRESVRLMPRSWKPSPMLWYYIWEQQRSYGAASPPSPRRVQQWLQDRADLGDLAVVIAGVELLE